MAAEKIYQVPALNNLVEQSCWHFIFDKTDGPSDDKVVYIDGVTDKKVKFGELRILTKQLAYGLVNRAKLTQDDVIVVFSPNTLLYPAFVLASQALAMSVSLANPGYLLDELLHHLKDSRATFLVVGKPVFEIAKKAAAECNIAEDKIYMMEEESHLHYKSVWSLVGKEEAEPLKLSPEEAKERTAFMCYSSGTTGRAKGVETTHYNLTSVVLQVLASDPSTYTDNERWLAVLPLYHMYGAMFFIFLAPFCGAITVVLPRFEPELWLKSIEKHRITSAQIVPPIALLIAKHPLIDKFDVSSVGRWGCGAAPLGNDLIDLVEKRTNIPVRSGYGMTETTCVITLTPQGNAKQGTVGQLLPGMSAKLDNGELLVKGPNIMKGYLRNPTATAGTFTKDGWMRTGDICRFDEDGDLFVIDRLKELIKYKGYQVPPADLEDLLLKHPDVDDAAVIGIMDHEQATEVPRAYVVISPSAKGKKDIEKSIADWVAKRVAQHKRLRGGVEVIDVVPKSASGKILRRMLRDRAAADQKSKGAKL